MQRKEGVSEHLLVFIRPESLCWCLAGRHNAQQGRSLVDHHLHRDLIVGLQELSSSCSSLPSMGQAVHKTPSAG